MRPLQAARDANDKSFSSVQPSAVGHFRPWWGRRQVEKTRIYDWCPAAGHNINWHSHQVLTFVLWLCHLFYGIILVYCRVAVGSLHPASWTASRLITRLAGSRFPMTNVPGPTKVPPCAEASISPTNQENSGLKMLEAFQLFLFVDTT
jgi:hypothetical protein